LPSDTSHIGIWHIAGGGRGGWSGGSKFSGGGSKYGGGSSHGSSIKKGGFKVYAKYDRSRYSVSKPSVVHSSGWKSSGKGHSKPVKMDKHSGKGHRKML
jgi:hypothetical protein